MQVNVTNGKYKVRWIHYGIQRNDLIRRGLSAHDELIDASKIVHPAIKAKRITTHCEIERSGKHNVKNATWGVRNYYGKAILHPNDKFDQNKAVKISLKNAISALPKRSRKQFWKQLFANKPTINSHS